MVNYVTFHKVTKTTWCHFQLLFRFLIYMRLFIYTILPFRFYRGVEVLIPPSSQQEMGQIFRILLKYLNLLWYSKQVYLIHVKNQFSLLSAFWRDFTKYFGVGVTCFYRCNQNYFTINSGFASGNTWKNNCVVFIV